MPLYTTSTPRPRRGAKMSREEVTEQILEAKRERNLTFEAIAQKVGRHKVWTTPSNVRSSILFSGLKGSEGHGDSGCEASVVPNYLLVNPQALSLGFSLESIQ